MYHKDLSNCSSSGRDLYYFNMEAKVRLQEGIDDCVNYARGK